MTMLAPGLQPIALIGISGEMSALRQRVTVQGVAAHPWGRLRRGRWRDAGPDVVLVDVAVSKIGAAMGAQGVIEAARPRLILNCGSAGAVAPDLQVGDLVLGDPLLAHDQGAYLPPGLGSERHDGFVHTGSFLLDGRRRSFRPDPALLAQAQAAARRIAKERDDELRLYIGPIATGDQVILQDERKRWLHETFGALAVEMEGVAVAQVAHCYGLPWLVLRGVSDMADSALGFDFTGLLSYQEDAPRSRQAQLMRILRQEAEQPGALRRLRILRQGARQAMFSVAALLDALLPLL